MKCRLLFLALFGLLSGTALGVPETELAASTAEIRAHYNTGRDGSFQSKDGLKLHYHVNEAPNAKGSIVLVQGRGERSEKYAELIHDLNSKGYSVYTYDHRGQGASEGRLEDDPQKGHVNRGQDYVDDLKLFIDSVVKKEQQPNLHILAHSMGGTVSTLYLQANPDSVKSAALIFPAYGLNSGHYDFTVRAAACFVGGAKKYARGKGPYEPDLPFENNKYTESPERFVFARSAPGQPTGGPTNSWVCEALKAGERAMVVAPQVKTPLFIARADHDLDARIEDQENFCKRAPHCQTQLYRGRHELLLERDSVRNPLLDRVLAQFESTSTIKAGVNEMQGKFPALSNAPNKEETAVSSDRALKNNGRSPAYLPESRREAQPGGLAQ